MSALPHPEDPRSALVPIAQEVRSGGLPLLLEVAMRAVQAPFFPGFEPLLRAERLSLVPWVAYLLALAAVEWAFWGAPGALLVLASAIGGLLALRFRFRLLVFALATGLLWSLLDRLRGAFPLGSLGLEILLTAVLVRVTGSEIGAAVASRVLLSALFYESAKLVGSLRRGLRRLAPAAFALWFGCSAPETEYFQPAKEADELPALRLDVASRLVEHPLLPESARTNQTCLACHLAKVGPTDLPWVQKGVHELHYASPRFDRPCVFCHENAGRPGNPLEEREHRARRQYNQKCATCHRSDAGPHWSQSTP